MAEIAWLLCKTIFDNLLHLLPNSSYVGLSKARTVDKVKVHIIDAELFISSKKNEEKALTEKYVRDAVSDRRRNIQAVYARPFGRNKHVRSG